jgi:hypothetical protein
MDTKIIQKATVKSDGRAYQVFTYFFTDGSTAKAYGGYKTLKDAKDSLDGLVGQDVLVDFYIANARGVLHYDAKLVSDVMEWKSSTIHETAVQALSSFRVMAIAAIDLEIQEELAEINQK